MSMHSQLTIDTATCNQVVKQGTCACRFPLLHMLWWPCALRLAVCSSRYYILEQQCGFASQCDAMNIRGSPCKLWHFECQ